MRKYLCPDGTSPTLLLIAGIDITSCFLVKRPVIHFGFHRLQDGY